MGAFFGSILVRTTNLDAIQKSLAPVAKETDSKFLVGPVVNGWISIFPEHNGQDDRASLAIANLLPDDMFHLIVHDDDIFSYYFYRNGRLLDQYNSRPDYFQEVSEEEKKRWQGQPILFQDLLHEPKALEKLKNLLATKKRQFTFESERMAKFVELLELPNALSSYKYLEGGETDEIEGWEQFTRIEYQPQSAEDFNDRGERRLAKGDLEGALADFNRAIDLKPDLPAAHRNRQAVRLAQLDQHKTQATYLDKYGNIKSDEGDLESALRAFDRAIELAPDFPHSYSHRGSVKRKKGDLDGALADFNQALELNPGLSTAYNNRALVKQAKGDETGAMADFDQALKLKPDMAVAYNNRGDLKRAQRDWDGAMADFDRAIELKPEMANAFNNRAQVKRAKGDFQGALADFDKAISLKPDSAKIYNNRGEVKRLKGDLIGALTDYDRAIELRPDLAAPYSNRGLVKQTQGNLEGALADFDQAIALKPLASAYNNRGLLKRHKNDPEGAMADLNRAIELDPTKGDFHKNRGDLKRINGDLDGALADLNQALELKPDWPEACNNRGFVKQARGDMNAALADYNRAIELKPDLFAAFSNRAEIRKSRGDLEGALIDLNRALEIKADLPAVRKKRDEVLQLQKKSENTKLLAHMKKIPSTENTLALRTDYSDETAWHSLCADIQNPEKSSDNVTANVDFISDLQYADVQPEHLPALLPDEYGFSFALIIDQIALSQPDHPILVVDLQGEAGRSFRVNLPSLWEVENNLSIANMDFDDFFNAVDDAGVYRGS